MTTTKPNPPVENIEPSELQGQPFYATLSVSPGGTLAITLVPVSSPNHNVVIRVPAAEAEAVKVRW